jgi:predicted ester cyclase
MQSHVGDLIADDGRTVARVRAAATLGGEFMGVPPTGTQAEVQLTDIMRFGDDSLVSEHRGVADMLSLIRQLGVVPG